LNEHQILLPDVREGFVEYLPCACHGGTNPLCCLLLSELMPAGNAPSNEVLYYYLFRSAHQPLIATEKLNHSFWNMLPRHRILTNNYASAIVQKPTAYAFRAGGESHVKHVSFNFFCWSFA